MTRGAAWLPALLLAACAGGPQEARHEELVDGRWHWIATLTRAQALHVNEPARYWAEFAVAGGVVVGADCNSGVGRVDTARLAIGPIGLTRRACGPDSQDSRFTGLLSQVRSGIVEGALLRLATGDAELVMLRDAAAVSATFRCADGAPTTVVFGGEGAYVLENARFRLLPRLPDASVARYGDGRIDVSRRGGELFVESPDAGAKRPCRRETAEARP